MDRLALVLWALVLMLVLGYLAFHKVFPGEVASTSTVVHVVTTIDTVIVYVPKYIPKIVVIRDTLVIGSPIISEIAILDTLIAAEKYEVLTNVKYHYPDRYFDFYQEIKMETDTVYVNTEKIKTIIEKKHNFNLLAPAAIIGLIVGALLAR